ncbi:hypothetical protein [Paenibacillus hexagrammi]|uniref:Uncharacterized protein n=1 Tax=Paenibacillus hexagrammi TaxID=2908839 RepID=A0ABY3SLW2_9BACL|nr:hypothetical protein [Paenibacillus sp. YPD9-1]UJF33942.1 hypothetical protein L0M14_01410 [Paenibacillus sp. YPD9-1]
MTIQDLRKRMDFMKYLGFDESKKMWVYSYSNCTHHQAYGIIAGKLTVVKLSSLQGLNFTIM